MQNEDLPANRPVGYFFLLVFALSIPFWVFGGAPLPLPINLPTSALMFVNPLVAASILTFWQFGLDGLTRLLKRAFDFRRVKDWAWYVPALVLNPLIFVLSYAITRVIGAPLPDPIQIPLLLVPAFLLVFFITGAAEELGWTGYAVDPLQRRWGALMAGIGLGLVWGIWHAIPYVQQGEAVDWIAFQILNSVALRVLIVWVYNNAGRSVFAAILVHDTYNVSTYLFPNYGSNYDPFVTSMLTSLVAIVVAFAWGPRTLARFRWR